jgi:type I restriction-modification system DNA methylase subunit
MSDTITQDEINSILWRAGDTFRSTVDPAEYKNCTLVMLFAKYISDVWRDHRAQYEARYAGDEWRVAPTVRPLPSPVRMAWQAVRARSTHDTGLAAAHPV